VNLYKLHNDPQSLDHNSDRFYVPGILFQEMTDLSQDQLSDHDVEAEHLEKYIVTDPWASYVYAKNYLREPWPPGEPAIASVSRYAKDYARFVLDGPFPAGEKVIATNANHSYEYAYRALRARFPAGEEVILTDADNAFYYAKNVLERPWPEAEELLMNSEYFSKYYKRFKEFYYKKQERMNP